MELKSLIDPKTGEDVPLWELRGWPNQYADPDADDLDMSLLVDAPEGIDWLQGFLLVVIGALMIATGSYLVFVIVEAVP